MLRQSQGAVIKNVKYKHMLPLATHITRAYSEELDTILSGRPLLIPGYIGQSHWGLQASQNGNGLNISWTGEDVKSPI